jgi:transcriptional regulator with XRE-family HTH domain
MRFAWNTIWRSNSYRDATHSGRRELELRMALGLAVRDKRQQKGVSQTTLAKFLKCATSTISHVERAKVNVTFEIGIRALFALDATDEEIAAVFNPAENRMIQALRARKTFPRRHPDSMFDQRRLPPRDL